ncbi:MAG: hydantoinase/oxoprolinase family protein, partial [Litoreibacter sp.]|nr:hydantoinase/oxoprolinase family protein [Litoreibacter sp.]
NMANAARVHAVENGEDLSEYTMIAFGGSAPLHAARLCEKLGVDRCLVPQGAGVGSAIGFLRAPYSFEANRSVFMKLSEFDPVRVTELFLEMQEEATRFVRSCDSAAEVLAEFKVYMRYSGQGWEIPVDLSHEQAQTPDAMTFKTLFEAEYLKLFGRSVESMEIEVPVWSVNAFTASAAVTPVATLSSVEPARTSLHRTLFDAAVGKTLEASVYPRDELPAGLRAYGPSVITEAETTIVLPSSRHATVLEDGCIDIWKSETFAPPGERSGDRESANA